MSTLDKLNIIIKLKMKIIDFKQFYDFLSMKNIDIKFSYFDTLSKTFRYENVTKFIVSHSTK